MNGINTVDDLLKASDNSPIRSAAAPAKMAAPYLDKKTYGQIHGLKGSALNRKHLEYRRQIGQADGIKSKPRVWDAALAREYRLKVLAGIPIDSALQAIAPKNFVAKVCRYERRAQTPDRWKRVSKNGNKED